jgi:serine/threonine protein kinase
VLLFIKLWHFLLHVKLRIEMVVVCAFGKLKTEVSFVQEAVDVWSLGVMAFELLTGKFAFNMLEGKNKVPQPLC